LVFLKELWSHRREVKFSAKWLLEKLQKNQEFVIFGAGGVGKSTLLRFLAGEFRETTDVPGEYKESWESEKAEVMFGKRAIAYALPGQRLRRATLWGNPKVRLETGKIDGIVIVSSFGYHDLGRLPLHEQELYDPEAPEDFLEKYLLANRADEREIRHQLAACCRARKKKQKLWVLEVITKQDLWFDEAIQVRTEYLPTMKDLIFAEPTDFDEADIHVETVYVSFRIHPFKSVGGEVLKNSSPQYTSNLQAEGLKELEKAVNAILNWN